MERIVLISRDVTFRGLIGAELIERGFDVEGVDTVGEALDMLGDRGSTSRLVILEARGQISNELSASNLQELAKLSEVLVCAGPYDVAQVDFTRLGIEHIAKKPLAIGELVSMAIEILGESREEDSYGRD